MKRIKKFGIYQTAKVFAIIYFMISVVFILPFALIASLMGGSSNSVFPMSGAFLLFVPFIYGILGFVMTAIGCAVYNLISQWTGGIEFEVETAEEPRSTLD